MWASGSRAFRGNKGLWEVIIGLEVHAQIASRTKLFSGAGCPNSLSTPPNKAVSLFDAAHPGTLPSINSRCVEAAVGAAIALNCRVQDVCAFDRKHYYYADLPAGFQITQGEDPAAADADNGLMPDVTHNRAVAVDGLVEVAVQAKPGAPPPASSGSGAQTAGAGAPAAGAPGVRRRGMTNKATTPSGAAADAAASGTGTTAAGAGSGKAHSAEPAATYTCGVRIERIQLEQDSGKSSHGLVGPSTSAGSSSEGSSPSSASSSATLVDLNRAGVGLLEVVTRPDMRTAAEAGAFLRSLHACLRHIGVCEGAIEEGQLRCDVNVSVRPLPEGRAAGSAADSATSTVAGGAVGGAPVAADAGSSRDTWSAIAASASDARTGRASSSESSASVVALHSAVDLPPRVELKNVASIRAVERAIECEAARQVALLEGRYEDAAALDLTAAEAEADAAVDAAVAGGGAVAGSGSAPAPRSSKRLSTKAATAASSPAAAAASLLSDDVVLGVAESAPASAAASAATSPVASSPQPRAGLRIRRETRTYDALRHGSVLLRVKEEASDYRFLAEPDLLPLFLTPERVAAVAASLPPLPAVIARTLITKHGLSANDAGVIVNEPGAPAYYDAALAAACAAAGEPLSPHLFACSKEHGSASGAAASAVVAPVGSAAGSATPDAADAAASAGAESGGLSPLQRALARAVCNWLGSELFGRLAAITVGSGGGSGGARDADAGDASDVAAAAASGPREAASIATCRLPAARLGQLAAAVHSEAVSGRVGKELLSIMLAQAYEGGAAAAAASAGAGAGGGPSSHAGAEATAAAEAAVEAPLEIASRNGWLQLTDEAAIAELCRGVLAEPESATATAKYQAGNERAAGALVARVLQASGGRASPVIAARVMATLLGPAGPRASKGGK